MDDATKRKRSYAMGYLTSLCGPVVSFPDKQPTAYSYNGIILPALPEWDKTVYPYAYLFYGLEDYAGGDFASIYAGVYQVAFTEKPLVAVFVNEDGTIDSIGRPTSLTIYIVEGGVFVLAQIVDNSLAAWPSNYAQLIWANADICDSDGILRRSADSEPVPVYE